MNCSFEHITSLQYRFKAACTELEAFRSSKKYQDMEQQHQKTIRALERRIKELEKELALDKVTDQRHRIYEVETELEEEKGKNLKLLAQQRRLYYFS